MPLPPRNTQHATRPPPSSPLARFTDYHDVIGEKLKSLTNSSINLAAKERARCVRRYRPLAGARLAQRAGLGFVGKHTNLISRRLGNWIFLAEILTTLELAPDQPEKNRCGSCTRCLTACPTAAITAPFQLDARRCISYLTIESKPDTARVAPPLAIASMAATIASPPAPGTVSRKPEK